jgi:hypothetical protein
MDGQAEAVAPAAGANPASGSQMASVHVARRGSRWRGLLPGRDNPADDTDASRA